MNLPLLFLSEVQVDFHTARKLGLKDAYRWHQQLSEDCFHARLEARKTLPEAQQKRVFLWRVDRIEHGFRAWVLSHSEPIIPPWGHWRSPKPVGFKFEERRQFVFSLRANPTRKDTPRDADGRHSVQGKRRAITRVEDEQFPDGQIRSGLRSWISRQAEKNGFAIMQSADSPQSLSITKEPHDRLTIPEVRPPGGVPTAAKIPNPNPQVAIHSVLFEGFLTVTKPDDFARAFASGIGSAKSLGFGLLVLLPFRPSQTQNQG